MSINLNCYIYLSWHCPIRGIAQYAVAAPLDAEEGFDDDTYDNQKQAGSEPAHDGFLYILIS